VKKRCVRLLPLSALWALLLSCITASAQITPGQDAFTNSAAPATNYGANVSLNVNSATEVSYILFNLDSLPPGASLSKATLKLFVNTVTNSGSFNVDFVTSSWAESTITSNTAPVIGSAIASNVPIAANGANEYVLVDISPAVYEWLNGSQPNYGVALIANGGFNASFDSKENTTTSHAPELDIVLASGGGTITGVVTTSGSGLTGGGTSGTLNLSLTTTCSSKQVLQWNGSTWACSNAGTGTITGLIAGTDLTGGGSNGSVTVNLDITQVPQLNTDNVFTQEMGMNGNLSAGNVFEPSEYIFGSNAMNAPAYYVGSAPIWFGSPGNENAFMGFAGTITPSGGNGKANTAAGFLALYDVSSGTGNVALGELALNNDTTGSSNTACGAGALELNATASNNTATGNDSLYSNSNPNGSFNTADGALALLANSGGAQNTAMGDQALYSNTTGQQNAAVGHAALRYNTTGSYNTAAGAFSVNDDKGSGSENTGIGAFALVTSSGNDLTCIGYSCNAGGANISNATAVGAYAVVNQSNSMVFGGAGLYAVKVGIGTAAPPNVLTIGRGAGHPVSDSWETYSSRRWKKNIHTLSGALDKVSQLRGVSYDLKDSGKHEIGVIAEEVGEVVPDVVTYERNGKDALSVDYSRLTALLIEAVKEEQRAIIRTQMQLKKLASQDALFESNLTHLESHGSPALRSSALVTP
jgi:trimeric autotransporter adhesin